MLLCSAVTRKADWVPMGREDRKMEDTVLAGLKWLYKQACSMPWSAHLLRLNTSPVSWHNRVQSWNISVKAMWCPTRRHGVRWGTLPGKRAAKWVYLEGDNSARWAGKRCWVCQAPRLGGELGSKGVNGSCQTTEMREGRQRALSENPRDTFEVQQEKSSEV